ncbi:DNA-binding protein [Phormidium sp. FACHB-322]|nr:DNA-binding protein [Phormidium sp. FACHB-77]MBD2028514.1 DNA-binding protein [Phormidium sp. FACHB-322]MBD2051054.1 DNA-binding protein [Leptolyngbya sp. FACHB-60]
MVAEVLAAATISSPTEQAQKLRDIAKENGISPKILLSSSTAFQQSKSKHDFNEAASYVLEKNAELYRRLA